MIEDLALAADLIEDVLHLVHKSHIEDGPISNDERPLPSGKLPERNVQGTFLEVDPWRHPEPHHVLPPVGDCLEVQQVFCLNIVADRGVPERATAKGERWVEIVENVSDRTL